MYTLYTNASHMIPLLTLTLVHTRYVESPPPQGFEARKKQEKITLVFKYRHECEPVGHMLIAVFRDAT